jgi:hypothetical protein
MRAKETIEPRFQLERGETTMCSLPLMITCAIILLPVFLQSPFIPFCPLPDTPPTVTKENASDASSVWSVKTISLFRVP